MKKPAALPWCTNKSKHYIKHYIQLHNITLTYPQNWQNPTLVPQEFQVHTAALPWFTNEYKHYINHIDLTHPQNGQTPTPVPQEVQVHIVEMLYPNTGLLTHKIISLVLDAIAIHLLWLDCYISEFCNSAVYSYSIPVWNPFHAVFSKAP